MPGGFELMLLIPVFRLMEAGSWRMVITALAVSGAVVAGLAALEPALREFGNLNLLVFFVGIACSAAF
jgi:hypothetical protein